FLAECGWGRQQPILAALERRDRQVLDALRDGLQVVLWFEHDLFDQLQLVDALALVHDAAAAAPELIVVGSFPGKPAFAGLGELTADELETLWPSRQRATAAAIEAAAGAWAAVRAPEPTSLARWATRETAELPFLAAALRRLLEELPAPSDGLSRTERSALQVIDAGARTAPAAFVAAQRLEDAPFLGDTWFYRALAALGQGENRLVEAGGGGALPPPPPSRASARSAARPTASSSSASTAGSAERTSPLRACGAGIPRRSSSSATEPHSRDRERLRAADEVVDRHALRRRVREVEVARPEGDRRDAGLDGEGRAVVPVVEADDLAPGSDRARGADELRDDRVVVCDLGGRHASDEPAHGRRVRGEPRVGRGRRLDPVHELALDRRAPAVRVGLLGQVLDVAVEPAAGGVRHHPFAAGDHRRHAIRRRQARMGRSAAPGRAQRLDRVEDDRRLLDRVHAALVDRPRRQPGVRAASLDGDRREEAAPAGRRDVERRRLRDDDAVRLENARKGDAARAGRFLVGSGRDDEIASELDTRLCERLRGGDHRRDAALHVARAAPVHEAVVDHGRPRVVRPLLERLGADDVDVPVEGQRPAAAAPAEAREELRPAAEGEARRDHRMAGERRRIRLPHLDLGADGAKPGREKRLQRRLVAADAGRRVEADQRLQERDDLVASRLDEVHDALLV